jgi:anti-sigma factor RsiW
MGGFLSAWRAWIDSAISFWAIAPLEVNEIQEF